MSEGLPDALVGCTACAAAPNGPAPQASRPPYLIVIVGPSGAGKSTLARCLARSLRATVVHQDLLLLPRHARRAEGLLAKYDWPLLHSVLDHLLAQRPCTFVPFDLRTRQRMGTCTWLPAPVLLLEGVVPLFCARVRRAMALGIYTDAARRLRVERQLHRLDAEHQYLDQPRGPLVAQIAGKDVTETPLVQQQRPLCTLHLDTGEYGHSTQGRAA